MFSAAFCSFRSSIATALVILALTLVSASQMPDLPPRSTPPPPSVPRADNPSSAPGTQNQNAPQPQPGAPQQTGGQESITPERANDESGMFVFKKQVEEVVLHATVVDDKQRLVTNLEKQSFTVLEDGRPQNIISFRREDIPVAMAIVIDNSGSMREKRDKVNKAAINLVKSSNPQDEVFIVNFNDEYYLDQDFTNDLNKMREALEKVDTRGGTALYDAVVASADHLKKNAKLEKRVLFVVTDGEDNESQETLEQAIRRLQEENGPTVYAIGLLGEEKQRRARKALQFIAEKTGGIAFFPKSLEEVDAISRTVAHDIRNQYTLGYKPTNPKTTGGYRTIKVDAKAKGYGKLTVRTKSGYYAGQDRAAAGSGPGTTSPTPK
jgi:Ca-activated chloride channel family protein